MLYSAELEQERLRLLEENRELKNENQRLRYRLEDMISDTKFLVESLRDKVNEKFYDLVEAIEDFDL